MFFHSLLQRNIEYLLPTNPGMMAFWRKFNVAPPLQNTLLVKLREPFKPTTGPLPAPTSNSSHPLLIKRRPDTMKPPNRCQLIKFDFCFSSNWCVYEPLPFPFCDARLPDIVIVSLVVIGASIDCDIDMPDTSIDGKERSLQHKIRSIHFKALKFKLLTRIHHRTDWKFPLRSH